VRRTPEESQAVILEYLAANPGSDVTDIFLGTPLNETNVRRNLLILMEAERVDRVEPPGHRPYQYWVVTQEDMETVA
jgi:hypothetical protein